MSGSYRDDLDAAQARIESLEQELAATKKESQALVLQKNAALTSTKAPTKMEKFLGASTTLELVHDFDWVIDATCFEALVNVMRRLFNQPGQVTALGSSFTWSSRQETSGLTNRDSVDVYIEKHQKGSRLRIERRLTNAAGSIFGGVGCGVGFGGVMIPISAFILSPVLGVAAVGIWVGGVYASSRALFKRSYVKNHARLEECLAALIERAEAERAESTETSSS